MILLGGSRVLRRSRVFERRSTLAALAVTLAYGVGFWLVLLHGVEHGQERSEPALLLHWLRDATLALPVVTLAVLAAAGVTSRLLEESGRAPIWYRAAVLAATTAVAASVAMALGAPLHDAVFGAADAHALPLGVHVVRDALLALAVALPLAGSVLIAAILRAAPAGAGPDRPQRRMRESELGATLATTPTRRSFVKYGVAGAATAGLAGSGLAQWTRPSRAADRASAVEAKRVLDLFINEGYVRMVDGRPVYMRGFGEVPTSLDATNPSLAITPHVFLADGTVERRRFFPLDAELPRLHGDPDEPCAEPAGRDLSRPEFGLHEVRRGHWASWFPKRTIIAEAGTTITLRIVNRLDDEHEFVVRRGGEGEDKVRKRIGARETVSVEFSAPPPGTYIYYDDANPPVNRVLGLAGALVVVPRKDSGIPRAQWRLTPRDGEFERQFVWIFHDIDPEWGRLTAMGVPVNPDRTPCQPRYFTLNERSGVFSAGESTNEVINRLTKEETKPCGFARFVDVRDFSSAAETGQLIRLVNTGVAAHQPHFHGNHVWTLARDGELFPRTARDPKYLIDGNGHIRLQQWEDVVELEPLQRKDVMLPLKRPPDVIEEVFRNQDCVWKYPMHCHAEMSQTAHGGLYPGGMVSDWELMPPHRA